MPRKPAFEYTLHKATGQACVRIAGKVHYLGKYGTHESRARHRNLVAAAQAAQALHDAARPLSVGELCEKFVMAQRIEHGARSWQEGQARAIALAVCERFAGLEAAAFGPKALQEVVARMLERGRLTRGGVNRRKQQVVAMFKWAVSEELVQPTAWHALQAVKAVRFGKGRENPPREPADSTAVAAVVARLRESGHASAAQCVAFMRATGCRPGEAYRADIADLRLSAETPVLAVKEHKNAHRGMERVVVLNSAAVDAVRSALADRQATCGPLFVNSAGNPWEKSIMRKLIYRACDACGVARWTPYQLRHLAATEAVNRTGNEAAAAAMLGHAPTSTVVRRYSVNRLQLAAQAAKAVGA